MDASFQYGQKLLKLTIYKDFSAFLIPSLFSFPFLSSFRFYNPSLQSLPWKHSQFSCFLSFHYTWWQNFNLFKASTSPVHSRKLNVGEKNCTDSADWFHFRLTTINQPRLGPYCCSAVLLHPPACLSLSFFRDLDNYFIFLSHQISNTSFLSSLSAE